MTTLNRRGLLRAGTAATLGFGLGIGLKASSLADDAGTPAAGMAGIGPGALADLGRRLEGTLLVPGDAGYEAQSRPSNGRFRHTRPLAVAQVAHETDVATCILWSQENGVPLVGRGGGHSYAGFSTTTGLLIDIRQLSTVVINQGDRAAIIGGGAVNRDYFNLTADGPLFLPGGTCLGVGVGGLTLGGGIGYNTHWAGLTCDHLRSSRIITASGELLEIDEDNHGDLFWACRGGAGGNFGINTSLTFDLVEAPQSNVTFYRFDWRGADAAAAVFATFHAILQSAPPALNAVAQAQASEVGDGGPRAAIDVFSRGQYIGPISELLDLVSPLLAAAKPTQATIQEMTFWDMQRMFVSEEADWHSYGDISRYAAAPIPDRAIGDLVDLLAACPSRTATANGSLWSL
ncbi:MAG: FAD-binding oxidoreductase, partial [Chloroflexia bacterium]|nr:FAD-binding oxidoreductase [Chloroflexia bacterium]